MTSPATKNVRVPVINAIKTIQSSVQRMRENWNFDQSVLLFLLTEQKSAETSSYSHSVTISGFLPACQQPCAGRAPFPRPTRHRNHCWGSDTALGHQCSMSSRPSRTTLLIIQRTCAISPRATISHTSPSGFDLDQINRSSNPPKLNPSPHGHTSVGPKSRVCN